MRLNSLIWALVALFLVSLGGVPAHAADPPCTSIDPVTGDEMVVECGSGGGGVGGGGGGGGKSQYKGPAMMWIRQVNYGPFQESQGEYRLWRMDQPLPIEHVRVSAADCGIEGSPKPSRESVEQMVHSLSASLKVPAPTIQLGPEPSVNEWNMSVVGLPIWLWTDTPRSASSTNSGSGMTININATLDKLSFDMGDGKTVTCNTWTPYTSAHAGDPSPTCGHTYSRPSLPKGEYTINATATWTAQWSAMGYTGTLPLRSTATRQLPVGELQAVVVRNR